MTCLGWLGSGVLWTLTVSALAWIIAFTVGSVVGVVRTTPLRIPRAIATANVELFRNIPLLVQMFLWYFVVPEVIPAHWGDWVKTRLPNLFELPFAQFSLLEFGAAVRCLGLYTASRVAEQVRAGIQSLPRGQTSAGLAMGLLVVQCFVMSPPRKAPCSRDLNHACFSCFAMVPSATRNLAMSTASSREPFAGSAGLAVHWFRWRPA